MRLMNAFLFGVGFQSKGCAGLICYALLRVLALSVVQSGVSNDILNKARFCSLLACFSALDWWQVLRN